MLCGPVFWSGTLWVPDIRLCACRKPHLCGSSGMLVFAEGVAESVVSANVGAGCTVWFGDRFKGCA